MKRGLREAGVYWEGKFRRGYNDKRILFLGQSQIFFVHWCSAVKRAYRV